MKVSIRLCKFNFNQLQGANVKATLQEFKTITDEQHNIINYKCVFIINDIKIAEVPILLFNVNTDGEIYGLNNRCALLLAQMGLFTEQEQDGIKTGQIDIDTDDIKKYIGKSVECKLDISSFENDKQETISFVWLYPIKPNEQATSILLRIAQAKQNSKIDAMDNLDDTYDINDRYNI